MNLETWNMRKEKVLLQLELIYEKMKQEYAHRKGRKPRYFHEVSEIVCDADLRRKMRATRFVEMEYMASFWLKENN